MSMLLQDVPLIGANQANGDQVFNALSITTRIFLQATVISVINSVPASPNDGDVYLVANTALSGIVVGKPDYIAAFVANTWVFYQPFDGWKIDFIASPLSGQTLRYKAGIGWDNYKPNPDYVTSNPVPSIADTLVVQADTSGKKVKPTRIYIHPTTQAVTGLQYPIKRITGTSYTIVKSDCNALLIFNSVSPVSVTVPTSWIAEDLGFNVKLRQAGSGKVTLSSAGGIDTIDSPDSYKSTRVQGSSMELILELIGSPNIFSLNGDIAA